MFSVSMHLLAAQGVLDDLSAMRVFRRLGLFKGAIRADPPRFEHGFEAPQAPVISRLHYGSCKAGETPFLLERNGYEKSHLPSNLLPALCFCLLCKAGIWVDCHYIST